MGNQRMTKKMKTIHSYFQSGNKSVEPENIAQSSEPTIDAEPNEEINIEQSALDGDLPRIEVDDVDNDSLVHDPGLRKPIESYPFGKQDLLRRAYVDSGPYQPKLDKYPYSGTESHPRRFQYHWFEKFPWLEYSPVKDAAYCFPCYLFAKKPFGKCGSDAFIIKGFRNWRKVNGKDCALLGHLGKDSNSAHNFAVKCYDNLKNRPGYLENTWEKETTEQVLKNRLRLKTTIDVIRWLTFQACAFRGHDERPDSKNQGNFREMVKLLASYNREVDAVVLDNAPKNATYTSGMILKELLQIFSKKVQSAIREEIGQAKFCLIVDESRDISKREQMAIVLRFVDENGFVRERFLDLVHVKDTTSLTLKKAICFTLSQHNLSVQSIRGQGYDGASNMRGEWNGLQALFRKECPYAYYVHCLAHQLQLALVAAAREVPEIHTFFQHLVFIVNIVTSSSKRHDELQASQIAEIENLIEMDMIDTGKGANQIGTLQRPGDTRWSSHFKSICSLIRMYGATCLVLSNIATDRQFSQRNNAINSLKLLLSFEFAFVLHVVRDIMGVTDGLCKALQKKSQDIVNAMHLVSSTKTLLRNMRNDWESLFERVTLFCQHHKIIIPDMDAPYFDVLKSLRQQEKRPTVTIAHHYRVEIFIAAIDHQLQELENRFSEQATELLILSSALNPRDGYKSFNKEDICSLAEKYYPEDFSDQDRIHLKYQLQHYELDVPNHPELQNLSNVADLCRGLVTTGKIGDYNLIDRLLRLVLTLPVSTATTERAFSAMKIVKTDLRNKMEDEFLRDYLVVYIEKKVAENISTDSIIDTFFLLNDRRVQLK